MPSGSYALRIRRSAVNQTELISFWIEHRRPLLVLEADGRAETPKALHLSTPVSNTQVEMHTILDDLGFIDLLKAQARAGSFDHDGRIGVGRVSLVRQALHLRLVVRRHRVAVKDQSPEVGEGGGTPTVEHDVRQCCHSRSDCSSAIVPSTAPSGSSEWAGHRCTESPVDARSSRARSRKTGTVNEIELAAGLAQTPNYRYADVIGNRLFVAGQVPLDAFGTLAGVGQVEVQSEQCLANLFTLVEAHGFGREDIHQLTIYVVGSHQNLLDAWAAIVRGFDLDVPPATLLGVQCLGYEQQLVELDARVERLG